MASTDNKATRPARASAGGVVRFRPKIRPPLALLHIYDDGEGTAETVRIRHWPFVIGRDQGDVQIRHDRQISSRHAQVIIKEGSDGFDFFLQELPDRLVSPRHARLYRDPLGRWCVDDLNSLNGVWLKVHEARLRRGGQFQCGEQRFRIEIPS